MAGYCTINVHETICVGNLSCFSSPSQESLFFPVPTLLLLPILGLSLLYCLTPFREDGSRHLFTYSLITSKLSPTQDTTLITKTP